jgi:hypothetical protein
MPYTAVLIGKTWNVATPKGRLLFCAGDFFDARDVAFDIAFAINAARGLRLQDFAVEVRPREEGSE